MMPTGKDLVNKLSDNPLSTNPALAVGAAGTTFLSALYLILDYAFPKIPDNVLAAIMSIIAVVGPFIISWIIRSKVWSPYSVNKVVDESVKMALETGVVLKQGPLHAIRNRPTNLEEADKPKKETPTDFFRED
jgi:hypothetical protein